MLVNIDVCHLVHTVLLTNHFMILVEPSTIDIVPCDSKKDEQQGAHG